MLLNVLSNFGIYEGFRYFKKVSYLNFSKLNDTRTIVWMNNVAHGPFVQRRFTIVHCLILFFYSGFNMEKTGRSEEHK